MLNQAAFSHTRFGSYCGGIPDAVGLVELLAVRQSGQLVKNCQRIYTYYEWLLCEAKICATVQTFYVCICKYLHNYVKSDTVL